MRTGLHPTVRKANGGADEALRTKLGECDAKYAAAADNPMFALFGTVFLIPGGLLVASICVIFAGVLSVLVGMALWESAMFLLEALKGILPGESRTSMAVKLAIIGACLVFVVLVLMGVGVFVLIIDAILVQSSNPIIAFVVIDLILLVAVIALIAAMISARRSGRRLGERMGRSMSPDPHAGVSGGRAVPMQQAAAIAGQHIATRRALSKGLGGQQTGDVSAGAAGGEQGALGIGQGRGSGRGDGQSRRRGHQVRTRLHDRCAGLRAPGLRRSQEGHGGQEGRDGRPAGPGQGQGREEAQRRRRVRPRVRTQPRRGGQGHRRDQGRPLRRPQVAAGGAGRRDVDGWAG